MKHDIKLTSYMALPGLKPGIEFNGKCTITDIINCVSKCTGITVDQILSKKRIRAFVEARQYISFLTRKYTPLSLSYIGHRLGGKDHTTVLHHINTCNDLSETDERYRQQLLFIENKLSS